jgi:hypothetical protein
MRIIGKEYFAAKVYEPFDELTPQDIRENWHPFCLSPSLTPVEILIWRRVCQRV